MTGRASDSKSGVVGVLLQQMRGMINMNMKINALFIFWII